MADRQWTAMLAELPAGEHTIEFNDVADIRSCKAVAYALNSDNRAMGRSRCYKFNVDKMELSVTIIVEE